MTLDGFFRGLGDVLQATLRVLQNDMPITMIMNYGCIVLGFVGLFYWLNLQKKLTAKANKEGKFF